MANETTAGPPVRLQLYGPVAAYLDGRRVDLGGNRERRLFVALVWAGGRPVSRGKLVEWVWDDVPDNPKIISEVVTNLRKPLAALGFENALPTGTGGNYSLELPEKSVVDVYEFDRLVQDALQTDDEDRLELLGKALELGQGEPLTGLSSPLLDGYRDTLVNNYREAEILFNQVAVKIGRHQERMADLHRLFHARPDDGRIAGLYMYVLYRVGRPSEAVTVFRVHSEAVLNEGLDVWQPVQGLNKRILDNDGDLGADAEAILGGPPSRPSNRSGATTAGRERVNDSDKAQDDLAEPGPSNARGGIHIGRIEHMRDVVEGGQINFFRGTKDDS